MIRTRIPLISGIAIAALFIVSAVVTFAGSLKSRSAGVGLLLQSPAHDGFNSSTKTSSTRDGVYTAGQAQQGKALYDKQCALCHGAMLQGVGQIVPLAGDDFMTNWAGRTLADLYTQTQTTMPTSQPGSLKPDEIGQLLAYILSINRFPAGKAELPQKLDSLKAIHIDRLNP
jgi:S-disulfanyl-L-cysteine oxidoreductase SoxD